MAGYIGKSQGVTQVDGYNRSEADAEFVQVSGDTMTGALTGTDLTLSGGVYLGGTGSANYLDDYEEGTFSPTILGDTTNPTVTYGSQNGKYLKVGSLVWVSVSFSTTAVSGGSGSALLGNLPFTSTGSVYGQLSGGLVNVDVDNATYSLNARVGPSSSTAYFQKYRDNTNDSTVLVGDLSGGTKFYQFSGCYSIQ